MRIRLVLQKTLQTIIDVKRSSNCITIAVEFIGHENNDYHVQCRK